jgi:hypothetical protein
MSRAPVTVRVTDPVQNPARMFSSSVEPSPEATATFLTKLVETGSVMQACARAGLPRTSVYAWRARSEEFAAAWRTALAIFDDALEQEVVETARAMGVGRWVPLLDEAGQPVLDDDFEAVTVYQTSNVDVKVLAKLIDKKVRSVDPTGTAVVVNTSTVVNTAPRPLPRLVRPRLDDAVDLGGAEFAETTEAIVRSPYEPQGPDEEEEDEA